METEQIQLDREDIVLLILEANERLLHKSTLNGITRLEKLLFLLEKETNFDGIGTFFKFVPHNFGPFSKEVYEAVEFLVSCELIVKRERLYTSPYANSEELKLLSEISDSDYSGQAKDNSVQVSENLFELTPNGRKVANLMRDSINRTKPEDIFQLDSLVLRYGATPLNHLIRYVYRQYKEMTTKSIHPEAQKI